jgi:very-short-patch-repair endonuclease
VAQARRQDLVTDNLLIDQLIRNRGRRGAGRLRRLLDLERGPALTRSVPERELLELIRASSLPEPETNQVVCGFEVDLLWRERKVVVEFDSRQFHSDPLAFERDRERDAELAANGYLVIRLTYRQLRRPQQAFNRIRQTLASR